MDFNDCSSHRNMNCNVICTEILLNRECHRFFCTGHRVSLVYILHPWITLHDTPFPETSAPCEHCRMPSRQRRDCVGWVAKRQDGAFASLFDQKGGSPFQVGALRPVSEGNCVVARRGGKQGEENDQSVTLVNSIRPGCLASLPSYGEAQTDGSRKSMTLRGSV